MKVIDNISTLLKDELIENIKNGSKMTVAASCFSMYAYKELKNQLDKVDEIRFIFTSPTFVKESANKARAALERNFGCCLLHKLNKNILLGGLIIAFLHKLATNALTNVNASCII